MTLMLVKPCCRWPRSRRGITAAFLYCDGYRERTSLMSCWFWSLKENGMSGLFTSVCRCCRMFVRLQSSISSLGLYRCDPYHIEGCASRHAGHLERSSLLLDGASQHPATVSESPRRKFRSHVVLTVNCVAAMQREPWTSSSMAV